MVLASRIAGVGGVVFLYRSPDLRYLGVLRAVLVGEAARTGDVWECANLFPLGDKWVLIVSAKWREYTRTVFYFIGTYADRRLPRKRTAYWIAATTTRR